ncbi:hypothetical protein OG566_09260 [Streptomyces sp. NBC_01353]|nr:hypothetical protein [Streptomyces sp. NBC_01353]
MTEREVALRTEESPNHSGSVIVIDAEKGGLDAADLAEALLLSHPTPELLATDAVLLLELPIPLASNVVPLALGGATLVVPDPNGRSRPTEGAVGSPRLAVHVG